VTLRLLCTAIIACHLYHDFFFQAHHWLGKLIPFVLWVVSPLTKAVLKFWLMANGAPSVMITGAVLMHRYMSWVIQEYHYSTLASCLHDSVLLWDRGDIKFVPEVVGVPEWKTGGKAVPNKPWCSGMQSTTSRLCRFYTCHNAGGSICLPPMTHCLVNSERGLLLVQSLEDMTCSHRGCIGGNVGLPS